MSARDMASWRIYGNTLPADAPVALRGLPYNRICFNCDREIYGCAYVGGGVYRHPYSCSVGAEEGQ